MKSFAVAVGLWSVAVLAWLLFNPTDIGSPVLGCMHLVGRSVECEAQQAATNAVRWQNQALPIVVGMASGYVAIVVVALAGVRDRRSGRRSASRS